MSQNQALDRLMKKQKPKVPPRSDAVTMSIGQDIKTPLSHDLNDLGVVETASSNDVIDEISPDIKTSLSHEVINSNEQTIKQDVIDPTSQDINMSLSYEVNELSHNKAKTNASLTTEDTKGTTRATKKQKTIAEDKSDTTKTEDIQNINQPSSPDIKTLLSQDIQTSRTTIRLEASIDEEFRNICHEERITKETWIEAALLYLMDRPDELAEVIGVAQARLKQRKAIADCKRAKTMQERFLN
ncbi:MAG: hypothetical protein N5P05_004381 (plasmid) [Chroococcopsis gigantea SAG 12.99]|jgi:hypothetical protein|nr:hypothetical protein [Chroococcopsis gigantea SAG 12.99]